MRTAKTLIRLGRCPGWSESSLGTHAILLVLSWGGSFDDVATLLNWPYFSLLLYDVKKKVTKMIWASSWQNQQSDCAPSEDQISLGIRPVWSESSLSAWRNLGSLATHQAHSKDWSDCADAQADLSLRWVHSHFVGFVMSQLKWFCTFKCILLCFAAKLMITPRLLTDDICNSKVVSTSRKLLRIKVTPDLHLTYSKNGENLWWYWKWKI